MDLLASPVRFQAGRALTVDRDTDAGIAQRLELLCKVRRGERVLAPAFGIPDPTFRDGVDIVEINAGLALFGPNVQAVVQRLERPSSGELRVTLGWAPADVAVDAVQP